MSDFVKLNYDQVCALISLLEDQETPLTSMESNAYSTLVLMKEAMERRYKERGILRSRRIHESKQSAYNSPSTIESKVDIL